MATAKSTTSGNAPLASPTEKKPSYLSPVLPSAPSSITLTIALVPAVPSTEPASGPSSAPSTFSPEGTTVAPIIPSAEPSTTPSATPSTLADDVPVRSSRRRRDEDPANTTVENIPDETKVSLGYFSQHSPTLGVTDGGDDRSSLYSESYLPVRQSEGRRMAASADTSFTQHKNASSSSFGSTYKLRLKLPATLKTNPTRVASSASTSAANTGGTVNSTSSHTTPHLHHQLPPPHTPVLFQESTDPVNAPVGRTDMLVNSTPAAEPHPPVTPDAININKFPSNVYGDEPSIMLHPQSPPMSDATRIPLGLLLHESLAAKILRQPTTPGSSFLVIPTAQQEDEESALLVKPDNFGTIDIVVASTINVHALEGLLQKKLEDPNVSISICDRASGKEMWRIRKSYLQLLAFDSDIRPIVEYFGLPPLPDRALFYSSSPAKVDTRRLQLQDYFNTLFLIPHIPRMLLFRICKYLSANLINPLDDFKSGASKEGFLIRRYKGLGSTWKVRWCQVDGPYLEIYDAPGGTFLEQLALWHTQIGRQSGDSVAEDKGYRHAFLILELERKMSSTSKHFFCAESDAERDLWIAALIQYTGWSESATPSESTDSLARPYDRFGSSERVNGDRDRSDRDRSDRDRTDRLNRDRSDSHRSDRDAPDRNSKLEDDEAKEAKKSRKRSLFPFRKNVVEDHDAESGLQPSNSHHPPPPSDPLLYLGNMKLDDAPARAVFGRDVMEAFQLSHHEFQGRNIPSVCFRCLDYLLKTGAVYEEGIFRLSGSASQIRALKEQFNHKFDVDLFGPLLPDIHTVAGLFKTYLRELPSPILGSQSYSDLQHIVTSRGDTGSKLSLAYIFRDYLSSGHNIAPINYDLCYVIFGFLKYVIENSSRNKMSLRNVCIVFVPTLNISLDVLTTLLVDYDCIFAGGEPVPDHAREVLDIQIPNF